jgi:AraC family transcriptional regulator, regulatory protein of adaptative response / DNA-3-methyladenine glycosylase II
MRPLIDPDAAYRIIAAKDRRYDGVFVVGVVSTGVYCRPSCSAPRPLRKNVRFFQTFAAAQQAGLRACRRCEPDAVPSSPDWNRRADVAARAFRLIGDGLVDREGVPGLARRLNYSERQINRILVGELGVGPLALARAQRAQSARMLIESTELTLAEIALAAGFGSIRQFNATMRRIYAMTPSELRDRAQRRGRVAAANRIKLRLEHRGPLDSAGLLRFFKRHEVPALEDVDERCYRRALTLEYGGGAAELTLDADGVACELKLDDLRDLTAAVARCRRLLDLDADPTAISEHLSRAPLIGALVREHPGVRIPGAVDGFELAVRTLLRHHAPPEDVREVTSRLVRCYGEPLQTRAWGVTHRFPAPSVLASVDLTALGVEAERALAINALARKVVDGDLWLDSGAEPDESTVQLLSVPGVGPWVASYIRMRALGDPDAYLQGCGRVRGALERLGVGLNAAQTRRLAADWRPWRSYAIAHLWRSLDEAHSDIAESSDLALAS